MLQKSNVLKDIRSAKRAHLTWVGRAELLAKGYPVTQDQVPMSHMECTFGAWYSQANVALSAHEVFKAIATPHKALHDAYADIFKVLFAENSMSLFQRMIGKAAQQKEQNQAVITEKLQELEKASAAVVAQLDAFEQLITGMSDAEVKTLFS